MADLNFYRRHGLRCAAARTPDSATTEAEERRRGFQKCQCKIYANGTLGGVFHKFATKQADWGVAKQILAPYLAADSWEPASPPPLPMPQPPTPPPAESPATPAIRSAGDDSSPPLPVTDAVDQCLSWLRASSTAETTVSKYHTVLRGAGGLEEFAQANGLHYLQSWRPKDVRMLVTSWDVSQSTRRTKLSVVKPFFEQFVEDEVLTTNPARIRQRNTRAVRTGASTPRPNAPLTDDLAKDPRIGFSDEELRRMLEACKVYGKVEREWPKKKGGRQVVAISAYRDYARKVDGEDMADFIDLSLETGLRFMHIAKFNIDRLTPNGEVKLRAFKNNAWISLLMPQRIQEMIRSRARRFGPYIFGDPTGRKDHYIYLCWYRRLNDLWELAGPWKQPPVHHRFRHAFVRRLLETHTPVSVVATLLGDTEETVRKHYFHWIPEIQEATTSAMRRLAEKLPVFRV